MTPYQPHPNIADWSECSAHPNPRSDASTNCRCFSNRATVFITTDLSRSLLWAFTALGLLQLQPCRMQCCSTPAPDPKPNPRTSHHRGIFGLRWSCSSAPPMARSCYLIGPYSYGGPLSDTTRGPWNVYSMVHIWQHVVNICRCIAWNVNHLG